MRSALRSHLLSQGEQVQSGHAVFVRSQVKNVDKIELGRYEMTTWYFSPLPMEFHGLKVRARAALGALWCWPFPRPSVQSQCLAHLPFPGPSVQSRFEALSMPSAVQKLYFCEYDLAFFKTRDQLLRHLRKCEMKHPPGDEIYR